MFFARKRRGRTTWFWVVLWLGGVGCGGAVAKTPPDPEAPGQDAGAGGQHAGEAAPDAALCVSTLDLFTSDAARTVTARRA
jgi:hypothetical protein